MLSIEGQFTFIADQPQLHCATFFIGEPEELILIDYDLVNIDCKGGDFLKVRAWQVLLRVAFLTCQTFTTCGKSRRMHVCMSVCVFLCVVQALTKQLSPGQLFLLPKALWVCLLHYNPLEHCRMQAEDPSPNRSTGPPELFQEHLC